MTNIIPVTPATLDIIEELNDGVRPALEEKQTFFVYKGKNEPTDIITEEQLNDLPEFWTIAKILYRSE